MVTVLCFTVVGSYVSSLVPSATMGNFSVFMTFLLGIKFIVRPVMTTKEAMQGVSAKKRAIQSIICGVLIGFICGFIGAGGGMMMLPHPSHQCLAMSLRLQSERAYLSWHLQPLQEPPRTLPSVENQTGLCCFCVLHLHSFGRELQRSLQTRHLQNLKPCHRNCACDTWHRGICIFAS